MQHLPGNMRNLPIYFDVIFLKNFQREPCSFSNKIKKKKTSVRFPSSLSPYLCTCELHFFITLLFISENTENRAASNKHRARKRNRGPKPKKMYDGKLTF